jgi:integrase
MFCSIMKKNWPPIKRTINHGNEVFLVDARMNGKGERRFFATRLEAKLFADQQRDQRMSGGSSGVFSDELASHGKNVQWAIEFALEHLRATKRSASLKSAIAQLLAFKEREVGATRLSDIRNRLSKLAEFVGDKTVAEITPDDLNGFLKTIPHPATRNDYRKEIVQLWGFAGEKPRQWTSLSITRRNVPAAKEPSKARVILAVEQAARLMEASTDPDICALNAMVLFGGLRREEVEKLDWKAVDFRTGHINVSEEVSKVRSERFAPMTDNLRDWLLPIAKKSGPIVSRNLMRPLREVWKAAKLYPWPQDAHRHSFISYRRQLVGDWQTALDAGTSEAIIKKHYKRPVLKEDAERYFGIRPAAASTGKVVALARR